MSAPIRVMNDSFQLLAEIEDYESLQLTRRWYKAEITIRYRKRYVGV